MSKFTDLLNDISSGNIKDTNEEIIAFKKVDENILSTERFRYPHMGDFYVNAVDDPYYQRMEEALKKINSDGDDDILDEAVAAAALNFFSEKNLPFADNDFGDKQEDGVIWMKGKVVYEDAKDKEEALRMGYFDADTLKINIDTIEAGDEKTKTLLTGVYNEKLKELGFGTPQEISVRLLGYDAPEVDHYTKTTLSKEDFKKQTDVVNYYDVQDNTNGYVLIRDARRGNDEVAVYKKEGIWYEYNEKSKKEEDGKVEFEYLSSTKETNPVRIDEGKRVQKLVQNLIDAANGEVYLMIDRVSLNQSNARYPTIFEGVTGVSTAFIDEAKYYLSQAYDYNRYKYTGFNQWGMDTYGRWMGAAYVKVNGNYINLAKYIIAQSKEVEVLPDYTSMPSLEAYGGTPANIFKLETYNYENRVLFDVHSTLSRELDDRRRVQEKIFKMDFDKMKAWNVTIGDTTFFVPPTSIRVNQQTVHDRLPIIRGKGSMTKGSQKVQKMIELTLYFNEERGINGYPFKDKLPNGDEVTYHMNGLRSLVSQFKFTPFLPIENDYINRILNIEAVALVGMQIVTNPSMPRLMTCVLTMQDFDYLQYMPELPLDLENIDEYYNPFSTVFNFQLMRWYYQRALVQGDALQEFSINDPEYITETKGCKTALFPMNFSDPYFKIYTANEAHLDKMHQIKVQKQQYPNRTFSTVSETDEELIKDLAPIFDAYVGIEGNEIIKESLDNIRNIPSADEYLTLLKNSNKEFDGKRIDSQNVIGTASKKSTGSFPLAKTTKVTEKLNELISATNIAMYEANIKSALLNQSNVYFKKDGDNVLIGIVYAINSPYLSDGTLSTLVEQAEIIIKPEKSLNKWVSSGHIVVEYALPVGNSTVVKANNINFEFAQVTSPEDIKLHRGENSEFIATIATMNYKLENGDSISMNDETQDMKGNLDSNALETLTYDELPLGEVRIKNLACSYGNNFTQVGLNGTEGYVSQYIGGQDTVIELGIETTDEQSVGVLSALPRLASQLLTRYRLVLPSSPIRFESEITRLLGVCEVVIENIEVATVPGQPGLYQINMRLVSMDRTMREREGIRKVNETANGGVTTADGRRDIKLKTYDELHARFGEAELYPDLELPTIEELEDAQFHFLRHKFDKTRIYPDPDFYFNYGHVLLSEIYREAVLNVDLDTYDIKYTNKDGDYVVNAASKDTGSEDIEKSENLENIEISYKEGEKLTGYASSKKINKYIENHIPVLNMLDSASSEDVWDIGEDVRVMLMEAPYEKMIETHERSIEAGEPIAETEWLYDKLSNVRKAREMIDDYLSQPIGGNNVWAFTDKTKIKAGAKFGYEECLDIFKLLGVENATKTTNIYENIVYAAACAKTGRKEYRKGLDKDDYKPDPDFIGYKISSTADLAGVQKITDVSDVKNAIEFGPFRTKMRTEEEIRHIITNKSEIRRFTEDTDNINTYMFLLDPYYSTKASLEEIEEYKKNVVGDPEFAGHAFFRESLVWLAKLIDDNLFPNLNFDILSADFENELKGSKSAAKATGERNGERNGLTEDEVDMVTEQIEQYMDFLDDIERPMDAGKLFLITALAVCEMDLYELVATREFKTLNQLKLTLTSTSMQFEEAKTEHMELRRFLFALIPAKVIDGIEDLSIQNDDVMQKYRRVELDRKYIEFADDPDIYTRHAFYDMCVHDMRGRMARAFPSFYIVLVDEGREIGMYKLNDNFYNINSISEIQVHKSRKIPADTCRIVMSNLYHTFTQDDEDKVIEYEYSITDAYSSLTNPRVIYDKEQEKRLAQQPLNKVKLSPGTRIHVRMGYGANAATLPIVFNGKITEVNAGDVMEVICQGDGIELTQPILDNIDADEVDNADKLFGGLIDLFDNASTPKEILTELLTLRGQWWKKMIQNVDWLRRVLPGVQNTSRYGYINFGDINYTDVFQNGEAVQNIFEAIGKPIWGSVDDDVETTFNSREVPKISIELLGKSFWDVLNICASATPDFIGAIAPFGMRSTVFHGHPRYYCAFDYIKSDDGAYYEKRKPFQQYHIVTSYADIIDNKIKADATRIKTNAVGSFKAAGNTGIMGTRTNYTRRMFVDWDIYPENQRSMIYDTQYYDKGIPLSFGIGKLVQLGNRVTDYFVNKEDKSTGAVQNGYPIANRMVQNALKNSIKDMYTGELILVGSPSLKPHDRLHIHDIYENMSGQVLVEAVTHSLSVETGLTSTVIPDCISVIDDQFEKGTRSIAAYINQASLVAYAGVLATSVWANKRGTEPILAAAAWAASKMASNSGKIFGKVEKAVSGSTTKGANAVRAGKQHADNFTEWIGEVGQKTAKGAKLFSIPGLIWTVVEAGMFISFGTMTNIMIQNALKNAQVLTIFPLMHNGKVLTAGLQGSVGLSYGSTNFNRMGSLEKAFSYLDTSTNDLGGFINFIINGVIDPSTQAAAGKYALRTINSTEDPDVEYQVDLQTALKEVTSREASKIAGFEKLLISPRIQPGDSNIAMKYNKIVSIYGNISNKSIEAQQRITTENTYVLNDVELDRMIGKENDGFFKTRWGEDSGEDYEMKTFYVSGKQVTVKAFKRGSGDKVSYDLPFLKDESIALLKVILSECRKLIPTFEPEKEILNGSTVTLTSALIIGGSLRSISNTGYGFVIAAEDTGTEKSLKKALERVKAYVEAEHTEGRSTNLSVFDYQEVKKDNSFKITVFPPDLGE